MTWRSSLFILIVVITSYAQATFIGSRGYTLRMRIPRADSMSWFCLTADNGFVLSSPYDYLYKFLDVPYLTVSTHVDGIILNSCQLTQQQLWFDGPRKGLHVMGTNRYGTLSIACDNNYYNVSVIGNARQDAKKDLYAYTDILWNISRHIDVWQRVAQNMHDITVQSIHAPLVKRPRRYTIRVLLDEKKINACNEWRLFSAVGFIVYDLSKPEQRVCIQKPVLTVTYKGGYFCVNGRALRSKNISILSLQGYITYDTRTYEGDFNFIVNNNRILCINSLDLESYVCSVVHTESWPGWPLEVNKAFAIMARSYAMAQAYAAQKNKRSYHVKNTNAHQTYKGIHNSDVIHQAVAQTEGVVLTYEKKPILAMFDCCCGGVVPMHIQNYVDFAKAPYLARSYACNYCKNCKIYSWRVEYDSGVFERHVCSELKALMHIRDAKVIKKDDAGLVLEVLLRGAKTAHKISGRQLYSLLHEVKSFCFDVEYANKKIILTGKGYGHHCGLCQWGAREMVRHGFNYQQVLAFYYPETTLTRMV